jgi:3-dehydroquinate dehydratase-2
MDVVLINGPNLDLLGTRQPEIYGSTTLADLEQAVIDWGRQLDMTVTAMQSNDEAELVAAIHKSQDADALVINPAVFTHTSVAIGEAVAAVDIPTVEVHISNVRARESWRKHSYVEPHAVRTIYGRGIRGYRDALRHLSCRATSPFESISYGPSPENVGDLRVPDDPDALVVLLHGGFLLQQWERDGTESLAIDLTERGYATLNLEYRRLGNGGGWPMSADDVERAFEFIETMNEIAGLPVVVVGHSAGGFLGLNAALRVEQSPTMTIGLSPITDLQQVLDHGTVGADIARDLLSAGAPQRLNRVPPNTYLIHAGNDEVVDPSHSIQLSDEATVTVIDDAGHFDFLDPTKPPWRVARSLIERAL